MTACPTCQYDQPKTRPERGGRAEDYRAHSQHAHEAADHLASRETSKTQAGAVRRHAFCLADKGNRITAAQLHANEQRTAR